MAQQSDPQVWTPRPNHPRKDLFFGDIDPKLIPDFFNHMLPLFIDLWPVSDRIQTSKGRFFLEITSDFNTKYMRMSIDDPYDAFVVPYGILELFAAALDEKSGLDNVLSKFVKEKLAELIAEYKGVQNALIDSQDHHEVESSIKVEPTNALTGLEARMWMDYSSERNEFGFHWDGDHRHIIVSNDPTWYVKKEFEDQQGSALRTLVPESPGLTDNVLRAKPNCPAFYHGKTTPHSAPPNQNVLADEPRKGERNLLTLEFREMVPAR